MRILKLALALLTAIILTSCGGGGGSAGNTVGSNGTSKTTTTSSPSMTLAIVDGNGATVSNNSIGSSGTFFGVATVKDATGVGIANKLVTFTAPATLATLVPTSGAVLTDATGAARVQLVPASISASGAGTLQASSAATSSSGSSSPTSTSSALSASLDFQTAPANVVLTNLTASPNALSAFQSAAVSVQALINGAAATSNSVAVNFSASCGTVSPASATVGSTGIASVSYQATAACSGNVVITALASSSSNSSPVSTNINVTAARPANIQFTSATPSSIVVSSNSLGTKQSVVKFQVVDALGNGMSGQVVTLSLSAAAISAGVTFQNGTNVPQSATSDASGFVSVVVSAGALPTPLQVVATLASNSAVNAASVGLAVTSGRPSQNKASISASKLSIEGLNIDGASTNVTFRVADRQSNPVPANTPVTFVSEAGLITGSCLLDSSSACTVTLTSQGRRPSDGRVTVLAYVDGEESFIDINGNNVWDSGETYYDMGTVYRDDDENGSYDSATEQTFPGGQTGSSSCAGNPFAYLSVANTCDGTWSSSIRVRQSMVVVFASSTGSSTVTTAININGFSIKIGDTNGNSMPTGTNVSVSDVTPGTACTASITPSSVANSTQPTTFVVTLNGDATCAADKINVTATSPGGVQSVF